MTTEPGTMPAVFVGHGNSMNALGPNEWTSGREELARSMPRPRAVLSVIARCRHDEGIQEPVAFPVDGYGGGGAISMLPVRIG